MEAERKRARNNTVSRSNKLPRDAVSCACLFEALQLLERALLNEVPSCFPKTSSLEHACISHSAEGPLDHVDALSAQFGSCRKSLGASFQAGGFPACSGSRRKRAGRAPLSPNIHSRLRSTNSSDYIR